MAQYIERALVIYALVDSDIKGINLEKAVNAICSVPAADVRPVVRGEWRFEKGDGKTCVDGWVCTACLCGFHTNVPYFDEFRFCPNCGADMRGNG